MKPEIAATVAAWDAWEAAWAAEAAEAARDAGKKLEALENENAALRDALRDMLSGWKYIRNTHGDLYGVGWNRAQQKAEAAIAQEGK